MEVTLIKSPFEVSFTGNPIPFVLAITPYESLQQSQDIKLQVTIWVEDVYNSNIFTEKRSQLFFPNNDGLIQLDVATIVNAYINFYTPKISLAKDLALSSHRIRFKISYQLIVNTAIAVATTYSNTFIALKGGLALNQWHPTDFFNVNVIGQQQPLTFIAPNAKWAMDESHYLFWIYPFADNATQKTWFSLIYEDGSVDAFALTDTGITQSKWGICVAPIGPNMFADRAATNNLLVVQYQVFVKVNSTIIAQTPEILIDYRNFYTPYQLYYRNSIGALESIRITGQVDFEADYQRQQATLSIPPINYSDSILKPQTIDANLFETPKYIGATGFLEKDGIQHLRSLFLSTEKYMLQNGQYQPIAINTQNVKFFNNKDRLLSIQIEWALAYKLQYFTPDGLLPTSRTCPAMDNLVVKQLNKNVLQIMWAIPVPYTRFHLQIIIGSNTTDYYFTGNSGITKLSFTNPISGFGTANITIKGRVICNEETSPIDAGAFNTIAFTISGDSALVAVNDTFDISAGLTTAIVLQGNILDNDYDPDNQPIEAVANTGTSTQGGSFSINSAGAVTYQPPSTSFIGSDTINYQIRRVGSLTNYASATITINVGSSMVYVKLVINNTGAYQGNVYAYFYANALGTIAKDTTGLGITISATKTTTTSYDPGTTGGTASVTESTQDASTAAIGTYVYLGYISNSSTYDQGTAEATDITDSFTINAGSGYIVI